MRQTACDDEDHELRDIGMKDFLRAAALAISASVAGTVALFLSGHVVLGSVSIVFAVISAAWFVKFWRAAKREIASETSDSTLSLPKVTVERAADDLVQVGPHVRTLLDWQAWFRRQWAMEIGSGVVLFAAVLAKDEILPAISSSAAVVVVAAWVLAVGALSKHTYWVFAFRAAFEGELADPMAAGEWDSFASHPVRQVRQLHRRITHRWWYF